MLSPFLKEFKEVNLFINRAVILFYFIFIFGAFNIGPAAAGPAVPVPPPLVWEGGLSPRAECPPGHYAL